MKRHRLKRKPKKHVLKRKGFYCKLHNNYRYDGKCNIMACEFCDEYYEKIHKKSIRNRWK